MSIPCMSQSISYLENLLTVKSGTFGLPPSLSLHLLLNLLLRSGFNPCHQMKYNINFSDDNSSNGTTPNLRSRVCGRLQAKGTSLRYFWSGLQRSLFLPAFSPTIRQTITSAALRNMQAIDAEPSPSPPVNFLRSRPTTYLGHRSQTEVAQGALHKSDGHDERIKYLMQRRKTATSLNNASQELRELKSELHHVLVDKWGCLQMLICKL